MVLLVIKVYRTIKITSYPGTTQIQKYDNRPNSHINYIYMKFFSQILLTFQTVYYCVSIEGESYYSNSVQVLDCRQ